MIKKKQKATSHFLLNLSVQAFAVAMTVLFCHQSLTSWEKYNREDVGALI